MVAIPDRICAGIARQFVERLERSALPRGLLLDDAYLLLAVHRLGLGRRAARAVVRPARLEAYANADVRVTREEADRARPVGVPSTIHTTSKSSDRYAIRTRNLQDWNLTRYRCANRSKANAQEDAAAVRDRRLVAVARAQGARLAVAGQGGDKSDHAVAPAFLERRRRGASVLGDAPRGMDA